jgi:spermidine synthase
LSTVLVIATAGLVYELSMAAVASYLLGDSVTQFSIVIGAYLTALGGGAYLSRFVTSRLALTFIDVELAAGLVGGLSAPGLFLAFTFTGAFQLILYLTVGVVGVLVGLELPLLIRILQRDYDLKELIARALTFDYAGALVGSLAFSLLLLPRLGLVHTSITCGLLNALVGLAATWLLRGEEPEQRMTQARVRGVIVVLVLIGALFAGSFLTRLSEREIFGGRIVTATQSAHQRIVLVERDRALELYLNGHLQFSSRDEHRYHEALVHPAMAAAASRRAVFIGGGGDGLAAREVLKWPDVGSITLVDLDPEMTALARDDAKLRALNDNALASPRLRIVNADAMAYLAEAGPTFDVMLLDFPDPSNYAIGKLYSERFYRLAERRLAANGVLAVQSTSPYFARAAYWCIVATIEHIGLSALPYHVFVPSFGDWGFVLAGRRALPIPSVLPELPLTYLDEAALRAMFEFPADMTRVATDVNRLNNQALVGYYLRDLPR